jgi:predicted transcriptional regulator
MPQQMLIRIDSELKEKLARIARAEGKSASAAVRELIAKYVVERDIGAHIDDLWERIGEKLKAKGVRSSDVGKTIKDVRRRKS